MGVFDYERTETAGHFCAVPVYRKTDLVVFCTIMCCATFFIHQKINDRCLVCSIFLNKSNKNAKKIEKNEKNTRSPPCAGVDYGLKGGTSPDK
jgi:hypothetical protein